MPPPPWPSPVLFQLVNDLGDRLLRPIDGKNAGAGTTMTAAAVAIHQLTNVRVRSAVEDAVSDCTHDELSLAAVEDSRLDIRFGEHRVDEEAIAGRDFSDAAEIGDDDIPFDPRVVAHDLFE